MHIALVLYIPILIKRFEIKFQKMIFEFFLFLFSNEKFPAVVFSFIGLLFNQ